MEFALLHSPFLSPISSEPLAAALREKGVSVRVLSAREAFDREDVDYTRAADAVVCQLERPSVLVVHSGAGGLAPSIVERAGAGVHHVIFVDAILPHAGRSWLEIAPEPLAYRVREAASEGRAPAWSQWFGDEILGWLAPDLAQRARLVADLPRVPMAFLEKAAPLIADGSDAKPCAYLQLSDGYEAEAATAAALGWKTSRLRGNHLWWLTRPTEVARAIENIATSIG